MKLLDIKWINWLIIAGIVVSIVIGFCGINGGSPNPIGREMKYIVSGSMDGNPQDQYDIPEIPDHSRFKSSSSFSFSFMIQLKYSPHHLRIGPIYTVRPSGRHLHESRITKSR